MLSRVVLKKRASANSADRAAWQVDDLLFVSNYGEGAERQISFAHFSQNAEKTDLPTLKVLGWDNGDTALHLDDVADTLHQRLAWPEDEQDAKRWREQWRSAFTLRHLEVITTSKDLAVRLAELARAIRARIQTVLAIETEKGRLTKLMKGFQQALIHDLSADDFADMYAQTIAYGLLSARVAHPAHDTADAVSTHIPVTNPFLKELMETFLHLGGRRSKERGGDGIDFDELGVSEVVELLDSPNTNMEAVVRNFGDRNRDEDPVIYFYELFLKEYDAKKRMQRGVFYTPQSVVSYIVRSVHELLQTEFGLEDGLADTTTWDEMLTRHKGLRPPAGLSLSEPFVQILDPATGTGTFLVEVIETIYETMREKWCKQGHMELEYHQLWNEYVPKHLLPRLYGFELMMAPYAIAHMNIGLKLHETGYRFGSNERARVYLTNTLEEPLDFSDRFEFDVPALAHEARAANSVKRYLAVTVIIGNPPYSNRGQLNRNPWISKLLELYKVGLHEKKINLDDDFIKFVRYAHWRLESVSCGVFSYITNSTYIDGVTHRQLRSALKATFGLIRILDLHGSSKKGEVCPDGSLDQNVFDIQQGVAIGAFCRGGKLKKAAGIVHHDLWGTQETKYRFLASTIGSSISWEPVQAESPNFFFVPQSSDSPEYSDFVKLTDIFVDGNNGFVTDRDDLFLGFDRLELERRIETLFSGRWSKEFVETYRVVASSSYDIRRKIAKATYRRAAIQLCSYRPFDLRFVYYDPGVTSRPAYDVMQHMLPGNTGLIATRLIVRAGEFDAAFVSRVIAEKKCGDSTRSSYLFPLYRATKVGGQRSFNSGAFEPNLKPEAIRRLEESLALKFENVRHADGVRTVGPEDVIGYIYAVLHSRVYRTRYLDKLRIDFPRIPLSVSRVLFSALNALGKRLVEIHLLENVTKSELGRFEGDPLEVGAGHPRYVPDRVFINSTSSFRGVSADVWNFRIGGYQVCEKWLKDRKGRTLSKDDIAHYHKIVVALSETIRLMAEIDKVIEAHGGWPGAFITSKN